MESKQQSQAREVREQYEAPAGVEIGTLAEMTAGVSKSGTSGDICKGTFPSAGR